MKGITLAAAVAVAALAPSAQAQNLIHVGVSGGVSFPVSKPVDRDGYDVVKSKTGYNVNGILGLSVPLFPLGLRAEVGYNKFDGNEGGLPGANARSQIGVLSGTVNAVLQPTGLLPVKPYLIGGVGGYRVKDDLFITGSGFGTGQLSGTRTSFGLNGGVGVHVALGALSTFLEARYHYVMNKEDCNNVPQDGSCFEHANTTFVPVSFGIMF
jgi:opacity protein-like surface antigen